MAGGVQNEATAAGAEISAAGTGGVRNPSMGGCAINSPTRRGAKTRPGQAVRSISGQILWRMPLRFPAAKLLGPGYSLRCLVFHDVAGELSQFTEGLGVTIAPGDFESIIDFACRYYTPISLRDYLSTPRNGNLPPRPILITFDDAYASVARNAAPILRKHNVPATFFVNSSFVGNEDLALDNLLSYVMNTCGAEAVRLAARHVAKEKSESVDSLESVFDDLLPTMPQWQVRSFREALASAAGVSSVHLAKQARLYVDAGQLRQLAASGFEIGSHTTSHVFCRTLAPDEFRAEIDANKEKLETITDTKVTAFSVPYGGPADLTKELTENLRRSGHEAVFLARDRANFSRTDRYRLNRINIHAGAESSLFAEIEILPRLRSFADVLLRRNGSGTLTPD